jgi:hypothetical protein
MPSGGTIHLRKDGPFYRVRVEPVGSLPANVRAPETHAGHLAATMAAKLLHDATGFPVVDHTKAR